MTDLVCDREFLIPTEEGRRRVVVEWMRPVRDRGDWRCDWTIHWPGWDAERKYAFGVDSTQALLLAMAMVGAVLKDAEATWLDSRELGLPPIGGRNPSPEVAE